jgi:membrane fusion protein (multidrug efflux system)
MMKPKTNGPSLNFNSNALTAILLCSLSLTACNREPQARPAPPMPEVSTVTVVEQSILLTTELPARTTPFRIAEIRPQVSGLIQKRLFTEGTELSVGQALYQIDSAPLKAALANAKAALGRAEANLSALQLRANRYQEALMDKSVSQQDADNAQAALKQTQADIAYYKASVETAQINLGYATISAPISGRIGKSMVTDGAIVTAYQPTSLATIQQLDPMYVDIPISTQSLAQLKHGSAQNVTDNPLNTVQLKLEDGSLYPIEGTLQFQDISVEPSTGSVLLRAIFPNPEGTLLPGMFVRAIVKESLNQQAILIPQQTVARDPKGNPITLIVDTNGSVAQRSLSIDRPVGNQWLVTAGLQAGEHIIAEGMQKVRPGSTVKEVPFEAIPKQAANSAQPAANAHK